MRRTPRWWLATSSVPGAPTAAQPALHPNYAEHQHSVPRLPIPPLVETCNRYLRAVKPLQTPSQHAATSAAVSEFVRDGGAGHELQRALRNADAAAGPGTSYLESLWLRGAYLGPRSPVVVHSNPSMLFNDLPAAPPPSLASKQMWRAAASLSGIADFCAKLRAGTLPPARNAAGPLCMSLVPLVLGTARLPETGVDRLTHCDTSRHVAVQSHGVWYAVPVLAADGAALDASRILGSLRMLPTRAPSSPPPPIAAFTADGRDDWAAARGALWAHSEANRRALTSMDTALACVVLDPPLADASRRSQPTSAESGGGRRRRVTAADMRSLLCGDGARRWYDKLQLIIGADGECGSNFEHAPCDGMQVMQLFAHVHAVASATPIPSAAPPQPPTELQPTPLRFELPGSLRPALDAALDRYAALQRSLDIELLRCDAAGLGWAKAHGVALDGLVQLAIQMAHREACGGFRSVYQACSTQRFSHGRTEVVRALTQQSRELAEAAAAGAPPDAKAARMVRSALAAHRAVVSECQAAEGHERHLLALKVAAATAGTPTPPIFADGGWELLSTSVISTSGMRVDPVGATAGFGFGPVAHDGAGFGYMLERDGFTLCVTNWRAVGPPAQQLGRAVLRHLGWLQEAVVAGGAPSSAPRSRL